MPMPDDKMFKKNQLLIYYFKPRKYLTKVFSGLTFTNDFDDSGTCGTEHGVITSNYEAYDTQCWQQFLYE